MVGAGRSSPCRSPTVRRWRASWRLGDGRDACSCAAGSAIPTTRARSSSREGVAHDPFLLGDMAAAVERLRAAVDRGERICVHGDYDVDGICATAFAVLDAARARRRRRSGTCRAASRRATASRRDDRAARRRGSRARPHGRLRHHRGRARSSGAAARRRRDRHRPPPARARSCRTARSSRRGRPTTRFPIFAARASSPSSPRRCSAPTIRRSRGTLDLVALATIADVVPLVDENRALATTGLRGLSRTQKPGPAGADAGRAGRPGDRRRDAVGFRLAPRINAAGRLGRPDVASTSSSPRTRARRTCSRTSSRR